MLSSNWFFVVVVVSERNCVSHTTTYLELEKEYDQLNKLIVCECECVCVGEQMRAAVELERSNIIKSKRKVRQH